MFVLAIGVSYANAATEEVMPSDMSSYNYATNGISLSDTGPGCSISDGASAGGLTTDTTGLKLNNGLTGFNVDMSRFAARNSCEESDVLTGPTRDDGVTIVDTAPVDEN